VSKQPTFVHTKNGELDLTRLEFPENFPEGEYQMVIEDVTNCFLCESLPKNTLICHIKGKEVEQAKKGAKKK
jgi:hypothetical protein